MILRLLRMRVEAHRGNQTLELYYKYSKCRLDNGFIVAQHYGGRNRDVNEFTQRHRHILMWKCRARKDVPDLPGYAILRA